MFWIPYRDVFSEEQLERLGAALRHEKARRTTARNGDAAASLEARERVCARLNAKGRWATLSDGEVKLRQVLDDLPSMAEVLRDWTFPL